MKKLKSILNLRMMIAIMAFFSCVLITKEMVIAGTNSSQDSAQAVNVNQPITGVMDSEYSWFQTELTENGYLSVDFGSSSLEKEFWIHQGWYVSICVNDKFILQNHFVSAASKETFTSPMYGYKKGTRVYVRIKESLGGAQAEYKLNINNISDATWESEDNNSIKVADKLKINQYTYGNFSEIDKYDYYYAAMPKTGYAQIYLGRRDLDGDNSSMQGWNISVYVGGKKVMDSVYVSEATAMEGYSSPKFGYQKGQKIYVRLENSGAATNVDYKIKMKTVASSTWETESNDSKSKADKLKINKKYYGTCMRSNDADWYKYKVTKTGKIRFYGGDSDIDVTGIHFFELYVNNKKELSVSTYDDAMKFLGTVRVKKGQTIYIKVTGYKNNGYAIKLK